VGDVVKRLTRAGFTRLRRQHEHFTVTHPSGRTQALRAHDPKRVPRSHHRLQ
jgi:predicted RNA binding protein YcfA (HicA-like mRNA interferase family)